MIHCVPDHPRSRGVYATIASTAAQWAGSSPLARGLLTVAILNSKVAGIIPARAGFTRTVTPTAGTSRDHPRSRGVYRRHGKPNHHGPGSSPLARGLPTRKWCSSRCCGIIPARAGFTCTGMSSAAPSADHPRSRGVYPPPGVVFALVYGSSPLARGLPRGASPSMSRRGDHPRSRGVYGMIDWQWAGRSGSSPLARGLPRSMCRGLMHAGIIPARAGFTATMRSSARC